MSPPDLKKTTLLKEPLDILNDQGLRSGEILSRQAVHSLGKIHRVVHLYLFDQKKCLLLQKRAASCDHYPNMWSISLTGHVDAGESSTQAVKRELKEELGLSSQDIHLEFLFSYRKDAKVGPDYTDRQIHEVFVGFAKTKNLPLKMSKDEVSELRFVPIEQFTAMVRDGDTTLVPAYKEALVDVLYYLKTHPFFKAGEDLKL